LSCMGCAKSVEETPVEQYDEDSKSRRSVAADAGSEAVQVVSPPVQVCVANSVEQYFCGGDHATAPVASIDAHDAFARPTPMDVLDGFCESDGDADTQVPTSPQRGPVAPSSGTPESGAGDDDRLKAVAAVLDAFPDTDDEADDPSGGMAVSGISAPSFAPSFTAISAAGAGCRSGVSSTVPRAQFSDDEASAEDEPQADAASVAAPSVDFPTVDVSLCSRAMLLAWVRGAKLSLRQEKERWIKELTHINYRKLRKAEPAISPQATPRATPRQTPRKSSRSKSPRENRTPRGRRGGRGDGRRKRQEEPPTSFLAEMATKRQDQVQEIHARGALQKTLPGGGAAQTAAGTPGFGAATPGFGAGGRATPGNVPSPLGPGPVSPGSPLTRSPRGSLATVEEHAPVRRPVTQGWGELSRLQEPQEKLPEWKGLAASVEEAIDDSFDELDRVMWSAGPQPPAQAQVRPDAVAGLPARDSGTPEEAMQAESVGIVEAGAAASKPVVPDGVGSDSSACTTPRAAKAFQVGDQVEYWSSSQKRWFPATVIEILSKGVVAIDKQNKGCRAKVRASELVRLVERRADRMLGLIEALAEPGDCVTVASPRFLPTPRSRRAAGS